MKKLYLLIFCIFLISSINAVPKIEPYVNDFANLLSEDEEVNLNLYLDEIEINTTWEIAIVTVENTEGQARVEYANKIGDENGVGKKDKDNGVIILYSLENEKGGAIATGRYSESLLNDAKVGRIGRDAKPLCDESKYYDCFYFIISELKKEIKGENNSTLISEENKDSSFLKGLLILLFFIGILIFIGFLMNNNSSRSSEGYYTSSGSSSSSSSGGSSGSSSSSSFGGGGFGGGGCGF